MYIYNLLRLFFVYTAIADVESMVLGLLLKGRSHWCQSFFGAKSEALACATDSVVRSERTPK